MKKSDFRPTDFYLWNRVRRTVVPLKKGRARSESKGSPKDDFAAMMQVPPSRPLERPKDGPLSVRQDKRTRRGKVEVDINLDLHDMTREQAFDALRRTLIRSYNHNKKTVLVVTGKGIRGEGVLRQSFPAWINHADIRPLIAEFAPAHQRHGGGGAWYVFLKN